MREAKDKKNGLDYSITHFYQPIYNIKKRQIIGYEALMRDSSQLGISPIDIFKDAEKRGLRNALDLLSIESVIHTLMIKSLPIFINIYPSTLLEKNFLSWWDGNVSAFSPVILELLESEPINYREDYKVIIKELRDRGIKLAIDDMGSGYSFLQQWIEYNPDYIKLDRYYSNKLSINLKKQKTIDSLVRLFSDTDVIIEGIETQEDLKMAEYLGIPYAQGYLLGRPAPLPGII